MPKNILKEGSSKLMYYFFLKNLEYHILAALNMCVWACIRVVCTKHHHYWQGDNVSVGSARD